MRLAALLLALAACPAPKPPAAPPPPAPSKPVAEVPPAVPSDPPPKTDGDVTEAWVHGMQILVKRIPGSETTETQLYVRGGVRNWTKADAGIELLALRTATTGGTKQLDKDAWVQRLSDLGSSIVSWSSEDDSAIGAWCLTPTWNETFALLVSAFREPAMPASQIEIMRARQLSALRDEQDNPDARLELLAHETIFKNHPYAQRALGSLETVPTLTAQQLAAHLAKIRETSRLLLVVVGDVDAKHVIDTATAALGDLPRGSFTATPTPPWVPPTAGAVTVLEQKLPTNYIKALFPGPDWRDPAFMVANVAMRTLGFREFKEVRTKRNLSYAPNASFRYGSDITQGELYVTAVDPIATMKVMLDEARRLRDEPVPAAELEATKARMLSGIFMASESPADQATQLASAQLHGGDWHLVRTLQDRVRAVTAAQVQQWAKQHLTHLQTFVLGDPSKLDKAALEGF